MIDLTTPEPPLTPPEPRQEHGHWGVYEVWVPDEPEWEPDDEPDEGESCSTKP